MRRPISKAKETHWRNWLSSRKSNSKVRELFGDKNNRITRRHCLSISQKMRTWKRPVWDKRALRWGKLMTWLQTMKWESQLFSPKSIILPPEPASYKNKTEPWRIPLLSRIDKLLTSTIDTRLLKLGRKNFKRKMMIWGLSLSRKIKKWMKCLQIKSKDSK